MSARRSLVPILLLATAVALLLATTASATPAKTFPTRIYVSEKFPALHGALHSRSRFCAARRRLLVYRVRPGRDPVVGRGWSRRSGTWRVSLGQKLERGHYYVIAPARASSNLHIRCTRARSKRIPVE